MSVLLVEMTTQSQSARARLTYVFCPLAGPGLELGAIDAAQAEALGCGRQLKSTISYGDKRVAVDDANNAGAVGPQLLTARAVLFDAPTVSVGSRGDGGSRRQVTESAYTVAVGHAEADIEDLAV